MRDGRLTGRERRVIMIGAAISIAALFVAFVAAPYARRWNAREEMIVSAAERLARLRDLVNQESTLRQSVQRREQSGGNRMLITARTPALAGSALQAAIQRHAERSRLTIGRLDVAGEPDSAAGGIPSIPAAISAVGDIYGLTEFLSGLGSGNPAMEIRQLTVVSSSALRGGLLQISLTVAAPSVIE